MFNRGNDFAFEQGKRSSERLLVTFGVVKSRLDFEPNRLGFGWILTLGQVRIVYQDHTDVRTDVISY